MRCYKFLSIFICTLVLTYSARALDYLGFVEPEVSGQEYHAGDVFEGRLVLYPFNDLINEIQIEEKVFLNYFYILKMLEIGFSVNNQEALEIKFRAIIKEKFDPSKEIYLQLSKNYKIEFRGFTMAGDAKAASEYFVLEQKSSTYDFKIISIIIFLCLVLVGFSVYLYRPSARAKRTKRKNIKTFVERIRSFQSREEFEKIYWDKYLWANIVDQEKDSWKKLSASLNQIQFKKVWSQEELTAIRKQFADFIVEIKNGI